jgi:ACS family D-galactonate transporter-like MFS transporter
VADVQSHGLVAQKPATERAGHRWVIVWLLFAAILVNYIDRGNLSIAAVPLMRDFGVSPPAMGTLLSAFFWTYALLQIPAGYAVDRFGLKRTYAGAFLLWSFASAAIGFATSYGQILALRLLLGVGEAAAVPASLAFIRRSFPEDRRGLPTAVYLAGMMLGPAVGAALGAGLMERLGWRMLFIFTGLGALVWLVPWFWLAPAGVTPRAKTASRDRFVWKPLLAFPTLWGILMGTFFYSYYWYFCLTWLPSYFLTVRELSFLRMGAYMSLPLLVMAAMSTISGRVADIVIRRTGRPVHVRKLFVATGFLVGSVVLAVPALHSSEAALGAFTVSLFGIGIASANYWAISQAVSPVSIVGRVIGCQNMIANFAGICAPVITGILVGRTKNFDLAIVISGAAMIVAAASFFFLVREKDAETFRSSA